MNIIWTSRSTKYWSLWIRGFEKEELDSLTNEELDELLYLFSDRFISRDRVIPSRWDFEKIDLNDMYDIPED